MEKKRYWLKLDKDFLKSSQIKVIKNMPNGKEYIIFYLSLLLESVETIGHLRFSDLVPYNEEMLASVTDTNIDIVRSATSILSSLGLMEMLDDGTIYMTQVAQMTGKESESAERVRQYRLREKERLALQCNADVTKCNDNKEKNKQNIVNNKKEEIINNNLTKTTIEDNIYDFVESNFGRLLSPIEYESINSWLSLYDEKIVKHAIKIAVMNNKKSFNYINGILNNWKSYGFNNLQQILDNEIKTKVSDYSEEMINIPDYDWLNENEEKE